MHLDYTKVIILILWWRNFQLEYWRTFQLVSTLECDVIGFDGEARKTLLTHAWPGNVRELRQKIMGAVLQAQTGLVTKEHLELAVTRATSPVSFALRSDAEDKERVLRALKQANGNRKVAAELLGIGRTTLYNKLEEYGLKYKFQQP